MRIRILLFAIVAGPLLASCSFGPRLQSALPAIREVPVLAGLTPGQSLERARTFLASRQYGLAIELFKGASRDPALEVDSLNGLAIAYDGIGRRDIAERYFQKALALRTDDRRTRRNLAAFYAASRQSDKRRSLLADVPDIMTGERGRKPGVLSDGTTPSAEVPLTERVPAVVTSELRNPSPLGASFRPLLIEARLFDRPSSALPSSTDEMSIACLTRTSPASSGDATGTVRMIRIGVGEVFIATEAVGTNCSIMPDPAAAVLQSARVSNKTYLGLVAAYLEQFNRLSHFVGIDTNAPAAI